MLLLIEIAQSGIRVASWMDNDARAIGPVSAVQELMGFPWGLAPISGGGGGGGALLFIGAGGRVHITGLVAGPGLAGCSPEGIQPVPNPQKIVSDYRAPQELVFTAVPSGPFQSIVALDMFHEDDFHCPSAGLQLVRAREGRRAPPHDGDGSRDPRRDVFHADDTAPSKPNRSKPNHNAVNP